MVLIAFVVFIGIFAAVILVLWSVWLSASQQERQTLERLESINAAAKRAPENEGLNILREELLSTVPWMNRWLQEINLFPGVRRLLTQADLPWTLTGLMLKCAACGVAAGILIAWRTGALPFTLLVGLAAAGGPLLWVVYKRSERFGKFEEKLPEALDLMVGALRAGHSLISALEMVTKELPPPISDEFKKCFDEQNFGLELREAMYNLANRVPLHDLHIVVTAILIQKENGGNLAEILDKVASIIRDRFRLKKQVRVFTAQGRMTGWILALLPVILGSGLYIMNPAYMSRLWTDATGLKLMYAAGAMTTIGALIIRKIVRIRV